MHSGLDAERWPYNHCSVEIHEYILFLFPFHIQFVHFPLLSVDHDEWLIRHMDKELFQDHKFLSNDRWDILFRHQRRIHEDNEQSTRLPTTLLFLEQVLCRQKIEEVGLSDIEMTTEMLDWYKTDRIYA